MRHVLAIALLAACSDDATSTESASVFRRPCDLSEVTAIDMQPGDTHYVVDDGRLFSGKVDVTDLLGPLLCTPYQVDMALDSVALGDWITLESGSSTAGVLGVLEDDRLVYETRTHTADGKLFMFRGEILERTRTWRTFGSVFATGDGLELDQSFDQLLSRATEPYVPMTFTYTFR